MTGAEDKCDVLIVGAGPAGLSAAECLAKEGLEVLVAEAMPSPGRKFLMAGKSGLNLTKVEPEARFLSRFSGTSEAFDQAVSEFGPEQVQEWARGLGQTLFTGSTGRVFPEAMKASPLLRAWLARLAETGVRLETRMRWVGWDGQDWLFDTPGGSKRVAARAGVLALGGASWKRLGSDGAWRPLLEAAGFQTLPFAPSNVGLRVAWSTHMHRFLGTPVKAVSLRSGTLKTRGEWVISERGMEGGGVYELSSVARAGAAITVDLVPDRTLEEVVQRLENVRKGETAANRLRKGLGLPPVLRALAMEWGRPLGDARQIAEKIKTLPVPYDGVADCDGAISTVGGVSWQALDGFMATARPGTFVCGEMVDWDAPTGGYLLTGCFASGRAAARQVSMWLSSSNWA